MVSRPESTRQDAIREARQYFDNARASLREKAGYDDGYYLNTKYVKIAGKKAYAGMLLALDQYLGCRTPGHKDVDWYEEHLTGLDRKTLDAFDTAYRVLYETMGRKGIGNAELAEIGLREAQVRSRVDSGSKWRLRYDICATAKPGDLTSARLYL